MRLIVCVGERNMLDMVIDATERPVRALRGQSAYRYVDIQLSRYEKRIIGEAVVRALEWANKNPGNGRVEVYID
jgi:hypothetical protein